jgi:hypothetical protein
LQNRKLNNIKNKKIEGRREILRDIRVGWAGRILMGRLCDFAGDIPKVLDTFFLEDLLDLFSSKINIQLHNSNNKVASADFYSVVRYCTRSKKIAKADNLFFFNLTAGIFLLHGPCSDPKVHPVAES